MDATTLAREDLELRILADPVRFTRYNPAQIRAIKALRSRDLAVLVMVMGNGTGKTYGLGAILSAIVFGTGNPLFATKLIQEWPYTKSARICAPSTLLEDRGPIQQAIAAQFPRGRYLQSRGIGKGYFSRGEADNGWDWDMFSYGQNPREAAGHTKGLLCFSEPPPYDVFVENVSRTRGQGLVIIECTPLNYAAWVKEELIDPGWLMLDGKRVGRVKVVRGDIWDNCKDRHEGGQLSEASIRRQIALWPPEEREAREKGLFMHLAGRVYGRWGEANELDELPAYHRECWDKGLVNLVQVMDPHDRKPWAIVWFAVFPNHDVVAVAEWPPFEFRSTITSPVYDPEEYRDIILSTESELGKSPTGRLIDPNFGNSPNKAGTGQTLKGLLASPCRKCKAGNEAIISCEHQLFYEDPPDAIHSGHILVRRAIGDDGQRPKLYALKDACPNLCYDMSHYGYREHRDPNKGTSEKPELIRKDFPDTVRYLYNAGADQYQEAVKRQELWTPKIRGGRVSAS